MTRKGTVTVVRLDEMRLVLRWVFRNWVRIYFQSCWQKADHSGSDRRLTIPDLTEGWPFRIWKKADHSGSDRRLTIPDLTESCPFRIWQKAGYSGSVGRTHTNGKLHMRFQNVNGKLQIQFWNVIFDLEWPRRSNWWSSIFNSAWLCLQSSKTSQKPWNELLNAKNVVER